jgi:parallel beta-helix repeat protein
MKQLTWTGLCAAVAAVVFALGAGAAAAKPHHSQPAKPRHSHPAKPHRQHMKHGHAHHWRVHAGQSIQATIDAAKPGDTIDVDAGVYSENLTITKDNLKLIGAGIGKTILKPGVMHPTACIDPNEGAAVNGICVLGNVDANFAPVGRAVEGTRIEGFTVTGFPGYGVLLYHADHSSVRKTEAYGNNGYGISGFHLSGIEYRDDVAHDNGEPGFYVGDSPHAHAKVVHNVSYGNATGGEEGIGILIRDSTDGEVRDNVVHDNCAGIVIVDSGENPDPAEHWKAEHNLSTNNNAVCAGEPGGAPPMSGLGLALLGTHDVHVEHNTVLNNVGSSFPFSGGIVVLDSTAIGGSTLMNNHVAHNSAHANVPFDLFWDGTGSGNKVEHNDCGTSAPPGLCS